MDYPWKTFHIRAALATWFLKTFNAKVRRRAGAGAKMKNALRLGVFAPLR
jgi:hypothetical protein